MYHEHLQQLRDKRGFNVHNYVDAKVAKLNAFFAEQNIDSAVLGISGGVDSAVVFKLLKLTNLKRVVCILMPITCRGTTNQQDTVTKGLQLVRSSNHLDYVIHDLTAATEALLSGHDVTGGQMPSQWTVGQLASVVRTPALYYHAAYLQQRGFRSLVVGTTNRDEGSYIGFFGKASDGMVDLQPIADIHKSEVYMVARALNVPKMILDARPSGDVWNGAVDEEMFGATYHFLEYYLRTKEEGVTCIGCEDMDDTEFGDMIRNIEDTHRKNKHKYEVGSPAHFIDVMPRKIPGGW